MSRIAVVGAGPAGCVATQRLITAGHSVVLFEQGVGLDGFREPEDVLDCGNWGTTLRLLLGLLAGAVTLFIIGKPRMDVVALLVLVALPLTGVLDLQQTLAGFSDANVILIAALFIIGDGLVRTGIANDAEIAKYPFRPTEILNSVADLI